MTGRRDPAGEGSGYILQGIDLLPRTMSGTQILWRSWCRPLTGAIMTQVGCMSERPLPPQGGGWEVGYRARLQLRREMEIVEGQN